MGKVAKPCDILAQSALFAGLERSVFQKYCAVTKIRAFTKGEVLAAEGDACYSIGVIHSGQLAMQKYSSGGDFSTIALLGPGDFFGEDLIFGSSATYCFTLEAMSACEVVFINKEILRGLLDNSPAILNNFLKILSDRISTQNRRIALLSQKSLRHKIAFYLLDLLGEQSAEVPETTVVELPVSKEVVAKLLAMPRPSFSRELIAMERDGLISVNGRFIQLLDISALEEDIVEGLYT